MDHSGADLGQSVQATLNQAGSDLSGAGLTRQQQQFVSWYQLLTQADQRSLISEIRQWLNDTFDT